MTEQETIAKAARWAETITIQLDFAWSLNVQQACEELEHGGIEHTRTDDYTVAIGEQATRRLMAEVDRLRGEVEAMRPRVQVDRQDIQRRGVTWAHVDAWLASIGEPPWPPEEIAKRDLRFGTQIMDVIRSYSSDVWPATGDAWRILDEMAAVKIVKVEE